MTADLFIIISRDDGYPFRWAVDVGTQDAACTMARALSVMHSFDFEVWRQNGPLPTGDRVATYRRGELVKGVEV